MYWLMLGIALFGIFLIVLYLMSPLLGPKALSLHRAHVLVTGGSSGIGKAVAIEAAKQGANISIIARNKTKLMQAKQEIESFLKNSEKQKVEMYSVDLSGDYSEVEKTIKQAELNLGPVKLLINCAGNAIANYFENLPVSEFRRMMEMNYFSTVNVTKAVITSMIEQQFGRIVFVSSVAGQVGVFGFTAYSAAKFALRGFAEALQMEMKVNNIYITLAFPPDTDTPGLAAEQIGKPRETKLISESAGLFQPDEVARVIIEDTKKGKFLCSMGLDGYIVAMLTAGMSPVISIMDALQQVITMGLFRAISLVYLRFYDGVVTQCAEEKKKDN
ncbi:hypothetical protein ScPMuIL_000612 [Solemya velum]